MQFGKWLTLGFGALCLVMVAGVVRQQHLYYMAALLLALPGVSYLVGWTMLRGLEFTRELPETAWEGEAGAIHYVARNRTKFSRFFLTIHEPLPNWIVPIAEEAELFNVDAGDTTRIALPVEFQKRGAYKVESFEVTAIDPLGVFAFTRRISCGGELVVYPLPRELGAVPLTGSERYGSQDFSSVVFKGNSVDPDGVRPYVAGDPLRHIHWRQTARTGALSVREFEESQALNLVIALDSQRGFEVGSGSETTLEYGVRLTASLAQAATRQGASVRVLLSEPAESDADLRKLAELTNQAGRGHEHLFLILDALARVESDSKQPVHELISERAGSLLPGTTLIIVTAHADNSLAASLARYTAVGTNVVVVYIDPASFQDAFQNASAGADSDSHNRRTTSSAVDTFIGELLGVQAQVFLMPHNPDGILTLEAVNDVSAFHAAAY